GQERFRDAQRACDEALKIRETTLGHDHPDTAESLHNQGVIYETLELVDRARTSYERALTIRETALGNEHPDTITTVHSLARLYEEEGLDEKADAMYQRMYDAYGEEGQEE
ncbi:MAG: tetratricopeptide repeat-containing protein, partial [Rhodothermales bacterium]